MDQLPSNLDSVGSSLRGFIRLNNGLLFNENYNLITRVDNNRSANDKVKLISGGGSGHEPCYAGFVGSGMLTTAVCGNIFASPSVTAILNGILVTGDKDCHILLIVNNYTGDRLNFSLAVEIARAKYGYKDIKLILINDDISIDHVRSSVGKRGLAGSLLIDKIAGAMAQMGKSLDEIYNYCNQFLIDEKLCTVGFTFKSELNKIVNIEMGKGIHGEPGVYTFHDCSNFEEILKFILKRFEGKIPKNANVVLLINNLGGTSQHLFNIFSYDLVKYIEAVYNVKELISGTLLTSLKQEGISVTLLNISGESEDEILKYLATETKVPCRAFRNNQPVFVESRISSEVFHTDNDKMGLSVGGKLFQPSESEAMKKILIAVCNSLIEANDLLNEMDSEYGDGDTGATISKGAQKLLEFAKTANFDYPVAVLQNISQILYTHMGGTAGALYGIFFQAASKSFLNDTNNKNVKIKDWLNALQFGRAALMEAGRAKVGDRTMLDPITQGEKAFCECISKNTNNIVAIEEFALACEQSAQQTKNMIPKSGRAAYTFSERKTNELSFSQYPDPGAQAISIIAGAIFKQFENISN